MHGGAGGPVILAIASSQESFWHEVLEVLDSRVPRDETWNLNYDEASRLRALGPGEHCILIVDFSDERRAMAVAALVSARPQVVTIAMNAGGSRDELVALMQIGVRDVLSEFTQFGILHSV